jgi:D-glycero-D-manno-heptose 1,7-bisphosphate phosphatase
MKQALILAGGRGTRLGESTKAVPKPLLRIAGRPFLDYVVENLERHGFQEIVILAGFASEKIKCWAQKRRGLNINVVVEKQPAGTAGSLLGGADLVDDEFLLLNGDSFFDINLLDLATARFDSDWISALALCECSDPKRFGAVELCGERVRRFHDRPKDPGYHLINGGIYRVKRKLLERIGQPPRSIESDVFPELADRGLLVGRIYHRPFIDIGVPEALAAAQEIIPSLTHRGAIFFDRDGVLNRDIPYVYRPDQIEWTQGALDAVKMANDAGFLVFVVTNQAGVARGFYDEGKVQELHGWMNDQFASKGAHVDEFVYCPFHPTEGIGAYRQDSDCRKPKPGMILDLMRRWPVDPVRSLLIGDKKSDMQAAVSAGIRSILYTGGDLATLLKGVMADDVGRCRTAATPNTR